MKKLISITMILIALLACTITVFAGSVPEDLLGSDEALIFFGEVVSYDADQNITVLPIRKVKGDVDFSTSQTYKDGIAVGNGVTIKTKRTYLMAYFDENNPLYVFETVDGYADVEVKTIKVKGIAGMDMWDRFQAYLTDGKYEQAEADRLFKNGEPNLSSTINATSQNGRTESSNAKYGWLNLFSLILGLLAWVLPLVYLIKSKAKDSRKWSLYSTSSFTACILALLMQIIYQSHLVDVGDLSALMDTSSAVVTVSVFLIIVTVALNVYCVMRNWKSVK